MDTHSLTLLAACAVTGMQPARRLQVGSLLETGAPCQPPTLISSNSSCTAVCGSYGSITFTGTPVSGCLRACGGCLLSCACHDLQTLVSYVVVFVLDNVGIYYTGQIARMSVRWRLMVSHMMTQLLTTDSYLFDSVTE